jgi:hypothetical protein
LHIELQSEKKTIIKMIDANDSFKGKLKLWMTQLMEDVLTHFPRVQSRSDGEFGVSAYILCIDKILQQFGRRFEDSERIKCTVSFIANPFQERVVRESAELISSVFKENVRELELLIINFKTDLSLKTRVNDKYFWNSVSSA